jgi:hypothetical protein
VRGKILADRAVIVIVQRRVPVRLVLVAGVPMGRGRMVVVMAVSAVPMRRSVRRDTIVERVSVAVMVSANGVQAGVSQGRDRPVEGDQTAGGQLVQTRGHSIDATMGRTQ